ncbi:MAG: adenine glycosylase [Coriobacteriaceae bacterium]|nr:adenine glycosylase [Coriobacteriaceae bacterium]
MSSSNLDAFRSLVRTEGARLYRDLPWRQTRDAYEIWLSEVMLQQTQVARVQTRWQEWLDRFPSVFSLAEASTADVLAAWQGMGYNRRALALKATAEEVVRAYDGVFPAGTKELVALPGIGPATAQGIRAFAYDLPGVYLETNVRTVVLHHLFPDVPSVPDKELVPLVQATCPAGEGGCADANTGTPFAEPQDEADTPRSWYYAMLDYGAYLKKTVPNPSRRAKAYTRQSKFEGSRRQKRAEVVRMLLTAQAAGEALDAGAILQGLNRVEREAGRPAVELEFVQSLLDDLQREGFCREADGVWRIA